MILRVGNTWALQMSVLPSLNKIPFGVQKVHLQCVHKDLEVKILLIEGFSIFTAVFWIGFRNEEQSILQDALGISIGLFELQIEGSPNIEGSKLVSSGIVICKVFLVLTAPPLARSGDSIAEITILGPFDEAHHEKMQLLLKIPVRYPTSHCNRPFTVLVLEDTVTPGLLVAYSHKFYIQTQSSWIYFVNSLAADHCGLLASFVLSSLTHRDQPTNFCFVPFILTACLLALLHQQLKALWRGSNFTKQCFYPPSEINIRLPCCSKRPRSTGATERSGRTYNQSYTK